MEDILKRFIYTGVGLLSLTTTRIRETIDELINNRKITEEEGRRIIDDFAQMTKSQTEDFEEQIRSLSSKYGQDFGFSAEKEIEKLKERVADLERRLEVESRGLEGKPANERKKISFLKRQQKSLEANRPQRGPVEKVQKNERVSFGDEVLTPDKKMEAERGRIQSPHDRPSVTRQEKDTQKASLGSPVLTPEKKVEQDKREAQEGSSIE